MGELQEYIIIPPNNIYNAIPEKDVYVAIATNMSRDAMILTSIEGFVNLIGEIIAKATPNTTSKIAIISTLSVTKQIRNMVLTDAGNPMK